MLYAHRLLAIGCALLPTSAAWADKFDLVAPPGSVSFGSTVTALSNGNFVVTDPHATNGPATNAGAVSLYDSAGNLISTLRGRATGDQIGHDGVVEVGGSNYVVISSFFKGASGEPNGAVTWCSGATGLSDVVSGSNSLVGGQYDVKLGAPTVTVLSSGNYVVATPGWNDWRGAATWGSANGGPVGIISAANSLVGSDQHQYVAYRGVLFPMSNTGVIALANGNYVVTSSNLATWGDGSVGLTGVLSESNSLMSTSGVQVIALTNGNYVVSDMNWNGVGAAAWGNGSTGTIGNVSASNALTGTLLADAVGTAVLPLNNGNYVVGSYTWHGFRGAVTWGNGATGIVGAVSTSNSLVGPSANDYVGQTLVRLCNGNYVVGSPNWKGGYGAATWRSGSSPAAAAVSVSNSLVGASASDYLGQSIFALANCNYVVNSNGSDNRGYVTWASGSAGLAGVVSSKISLVGAAANDLAGQVIALSNGNYVVVSSYGGLGAVTWVDGSKRFVGTVSSSNSLAGTPLGYAGPIVAALPNGNYLVGTPTLNNNTGAVTWGNGATGTRGVVSIANSLFGVSAGDQLGSYGIYAFDDNNFAIDTPNWNGGRAAITLGNGAYRQTGIVVASATAAGSNTATWPLPFAYDKQHHRLIVGRPADNVVTIFTMDEIFRDGWD